MGNILKLLVFGAAGIPWLGSSPAQSASPSAAVRIVGKSYGASPALRTLPYASAEALKTFQQFLPLRHPRPVTSTSGTAIPSDSALQTFAATAVSAPIGVNVLGLGAGFPSFKVTVVAPDTNAAVGATQVVEVVKTSIQVFDKTTGASVGTPVALSTLVTTGDNCQKGQLSDPIVLFDKTNGRWVITYIAATDLNKLIGPFLQCFAVSTTNDATGTYFIYSFDVSTLGGMNDYDKMGIWPDAYYMSYNEFDLTDKFLGATPCAFQSSVMIAGRAGPLLICFAPILTEDSLLPADVDGATPPSLGEPEFFIGTIDSRESFHVSQFHVDFVTPANSTFTGPANVKVSPFREACGGGVCVEQPSGGTLLDSLGDRLMYRAAYRNFGTHESVVLSHSVQAAESTGIRWYELRSPAASPFIFQQGTFAPNELFRWMPSIAMDHDGDIAVGYSVSGRRVFPSVRYTGRKSMQPKGQMSAEAAIVKGAGVKFSRDTGWGDYSSMSIDPIDDCTFWYAQEYILTSGKFHWSTRLASFKFPECE